LRSATLTHQLSEGIEAVLFYTLSEIVGYVIQIVIVLVIVQFILSLLISFNVVNMHNDFVAAIWRAINALLDPILRPIRRIMPDTGMIDFSPLVLIIGLNIINIILRNLAVGSLA
jgi:YggT family protein